VLSTTLAFILAVVIVKTPPASVTQKAGVPHVAFTESEVLAGIDEADVYWIRMMSSLQTCSRIRPALNVKVTPVASIVYGPVGGVEQLSAEDPPAAVPPVATTPPVDERPPDVPPKP